MKAILLGCPYTGLSSIEIALTELGVGGVVVLKTENITRISNDGFSVGSKSYDYGEVRASFIRYPYDLIPPHSHSYSLREETEFYKTIALMLDEVSINRVSSTWAYRNRSFSLAAAKSKGCNVPNFSLYKKSDYTQLEIHDAVAVKAIGNCFVTENVSELSVSQQEYLCIEEDDGDTAAVFSASKFDPENAATYLDNFGYMFSQNIVVSKLELRCYLVGKQFIIYMREVSDRFDKSFASYAKTSYELNEKTRNAILEIATKEKFGYLCFDVIVDNQDVEFLIDINPYGSFPSYKLFPELSIALAKELVERCVNV